MTFTFLITAAVLIILLIIPQIMKRVVYKKLTGYLSERDYERFEKLLDGFACTFSFKPYNREYMRLNSYFMQGDKRKIEAQLDTIFSKMKMRDQQRQPLPDRDFISIWKIRSLRKQKACCISVERLIKIPQSFIRWK